MSIQTAHAAGSPGLNIVSGNGQVVWTSWRTTAPMVVQAIDGAGNPVPNLEVTWTVSKGEGTLIGATVPEGQPNPCPNVNACQTDANGYARMYFIGGGVPPGASFQSAEITASTSLGSATFIITASQRTFVNGTTADLPALQNLAPPDANRKLSGAEGATLPGAVSVRVIAIGGAQQGFPVPNVGLHIVDPQNPSSPSPAAQCSGPVLTNTDGVASCDLVLTGKPGIYSIAAMIGDYRMTSPISLTITPAPTCSYRFSPGSLALPAAGGPSSVTLDTTAGCAWTLASNADWITITSATTGSGRAQINLNVAPNTGAARTGAITAGGQTLSIAQAAGGVGPLGFSTATTLPAHQAGSPYSFTIVASGGHPPYTFSGTMPPGFTLDPTTGTISAAGPAAGSYSFPITVRDAAGATASATFSLSVQTTLPGGGGPPTINDTTFPPAVVGVAYSRDISTAGGCSPFAARRIELASGTLPPGLTLGLVGSKYAISGTPTTAGDFSFVLRVTEDNCGSTTANVTLSVTTGASGGSLTLAPSSVDFTATAGAAPPDQQVTVSGPAGESWSASVHTDTGGDWLSLASSSTGVTGSSVTLHAAPGTLAAGTYTGSLTVAAASGSVTIPVKLTIAGSSSLTADVTDIVFEQTLPAASTRLQKTVKVTAGTPAHFIAYATAPGGNWLTVSPPQGSTPASLMVTADTSGLAAGEYPAFVTVATASAPGTLVNIPVTLKISAVPELTSSATKIELSVAAGAAEPSEQTITVQSSADPVKITAKAETTSGGNWLSVSPAEGDTPTELTVSIDPTSLNPGKYEGTVTISSPVEGVAPITTPVSLEVTAPGPTITAVANGASFAPGPVSPGEVVVISGMNMGGNDLVSADLSGESIPSELAGTKVYFHGFEAPLLYASAGQVSAIVPYDVAGLTETDIVVEYHGVRSSAMTVPVTDAAPGLFLAAEGVAAALNQDNSANTQQNPAAPGSVVVLFATGEGVTDPASNTGTISNMPFEELPKPKLPVSVTVDGKDAQIQYAGAAPMMPAGVMQLNIVLPDGLTPGTAVPVVVKVGDHESPAASIYVQ